MNDYYYLEYSDCCLHFHSYTHNILADVTFGLFQVFLGGSYVQYKTPEEGQRSHRQKPCEYYNEDEDDSPNVQSDKNYQALSQKFK